jgi:hypothetical protein
MMRYVVTRDQAVEFTMARTDIAIWGDDIFDNLKMDGDGQWEGIVSGSMDSTSGGMINEMDADTFEKEYGIVPPKAGSKSYLRAEYTWE